MFEMLVADGISRPGDRLKLLAGYQPCFKSKFDTLHILRPGEMHCLIRVIEKQSLSCLKRRLTKTNCENKQPSFEAFIKHIIPMTC